MRQEEIRGPYRERTMKGSSAYLDVIAARKGTLKSVVRGSHWPRRARKLHPGHRL